MLKTIKVQDAIGTVLAHDITEIKAHHEFKGPAFKKGHIITKDDIPRLLDLGKKNLFVLKITDDEVHEDEAGERIARAIAGKGVYLSDDVKEGRVNLYAAYAGLLRINTEALEELNLLDEVMCATRHNNFLVKKGEILAGTRTIPLLIKRQTVEKVENLSLEYGKILEVLSLRAIKAGLLITGS